MISSPSGNTQWQVCWCQELPNHLDRTLTIYVPTHSLVCCMWERADSKHLLALNLKFVCERGLSSWLLVFLVFLKKKTPQIYFLSWPCGFLESVNTRQNCVLSRWLGSGNHAPGTHLWMESKRRGGTLRRDYTGNEGFGWRLYSLLAADSAPGVAGDHLKDLLHHHLQRPDLYLRFTSNMSVTEVKPCINSQRPPRNTFHLCGWWADQHCGWGRGGQWESDSRRRRHRSVSADFESLPKKRDRRGEPSGGGFPFFFSRAYRVGGVVLENCVVVLAGLVVPSETREHGLQRLLTDPRPQSHKKKGEEIKSRQHNHTPVYIAAGS